MTQFSDGLALGPCQYNRANNANLGVPVSHTFFYETGAVASASTTAILSAGTGSGAGTFTLNGALVSGGVATIPTPRNITLTSTSNNSGITLTVTGTDVYGAAQTETITGPNNTTVNGAKAFKTITAVARSNTVTGNVSAGTGNVLGLPYAIANAAKVVGAYMDGIPQTTATFVAADATAATATTGDVRGTYTPNSAPNGTRRYVVGILVDTTTKESAYGVTPA